MAKDIDPSLARGLARGIVRETEAQDRDVAKAALAKRNRLPPPTTPAGFYRRAVSIYRDRSAGGLVGERQFGSGRGKKGDEHFFVMWDAVADEGRLGLGVLWLRHLTSTVVDYSPLILSQHACERLFQRLGTTDRNAVRSELRSCTTPLLRLWAGMRQPEIAAELENGRSVLLPTKSGGLFVERHGKTAIKPHLAGTTWIDDEKLRPDQRYAMKAMADKSLLIGAAGNHIPVPADYWPEAKMNMSMYGREREMRI